MNSLRALEDVPDKNVRDILLQMDRRGNSATMSVAQKREGQLAGVRRAGPLADVASIQNEVFTNRAGERVTIRIYRPENDTASLPVVLYAHGGGFFAGSLDTHDPVCRAVCRDTPAIVAAVDYRLAPEHPWPAALEDTLDALAWISERLHPKRLIIAGDSAGGNLAACAAIETKVPLAGQVLIYPMLDAAMSLPAYVENALVPPFTLLDCVYVWQLALPRGADRIDPRLSPIYAPREHLQKLPRALVLTAEYDILRDDGREYTALLQSAGVRTGHEHYGEMTHGFLLWGATVPAAHQALDRIARFVREL